MFAKDSHQAPPVLLRVRVPRSHSLAGLVLALLIAAACSWLVWRATTGRSPMPALMIVGLVLVTLAMSVGTLAFIRMFAHPPTMLDATQAGLVSYVSARSGRYSAAGLLIPWNVIRRIDFYSTAAAAGTDRLRIRSARLSLVPGHSMPIGEVSILRPMHSAFGGSASLNTGIDWENTIFLNAVTDFGAPEQYVKQLEIFRQQYDD